MSDQNDDITTEDDAVENVLNFKTAKYLAIFLLVVIIVGFVISFINFQLSANKGEHVKYFWVELNIPKGYPDTVYKDRIIYMDTTHVAQDTVHHDTVSQAAKAVPAAPAPPPVVSETPRPARAHDNSTAAAAPAHSDYIYHLTDDDKNAIPYQIEALKKANNIQSNEVEIAHVYHSNGVVFMQELDAFLRSKGYTPDGGNGSRMIFGSSGRKGWWIELKEGTKKIMIGVGTF